MAAAATSPVKAPVGAGMQRGAGLRQRAHPTTAGGSGRAAAAGAQETSGGSGAENVPGRAPPPPGVGEGRLGDSGGRGANARAGGRARPGLFIRSGARALCGLPVRVAADVRVPGPDISAPGLQPVGRGGFLGRAPRSRGSRSRRAVLLGGSLKGATARRTPSCGEGLRADGRQFKEGCGLDPSSSGDVPGPPGPRPNEIPTCFARLACGPAPQRSGRELLVLFRMWCPEAHVRGGCLEVLP